MNSYLTNKHYSIMERKNYLKPTLKAVEYEHGEMLLNASKPATGMKDYTLEDGDEW